MPKPVNKGVGHYKPPEFWGMPRSALDAMPWTVCWCSNQHYQASDVPTPGDVRDVSKATATTDKPGDDNEQSTSVSLKIAEASYTNDLPKGAEVSKQDEDP